MSLVLYLIYVVGAFSLYMMWLLGFKVFVEVVVPWLVFVAVIFAPLVWMTVRRDRNGI